MKRPGRTVQLFDKPITFLDFLDQLHRFNGSGLAGASQFVNAINKTVDLVHAGF